MRASAPCKLSVIQQFVVVKLFYELQLQLTVPHLVAVADDSGPILSTPEAEDDPIIAIYFWVLCLTTQ